MNPPCVHQVLPRVPGQVGPLRDTAITEEQLAALFRAVAADDPGTGITFDDGYRSVIDIALPLAERHRVPITAFVTTGFLDGTHRPVEEALAALVHARARVRTLAGRHLSTASATEREGVYRRLVRAARRCGRRAHAYAGALLARNGVAPVERQGEGFLDWSQVRTLAGHPLVTIGAHTLTHPNLKYVGPRGAWQELRAARARLERETGRAITAVAYPYGRSWSWTRQLARQAGYDTGFGTDDAPAPAVRGRPADPMNIRRDTITHEAAHG